jgi:hypothetical protein
VESDLAAAELEPSDAGVDGVVGVIGVVTLAHELLLAV